MTYKWRDIVLFAGIAVVVGYLVGQSGLMSESFAQSTSSSGEISVMMAAEDRNNKTPFVIVDNVEKTIMVYEYDTSNSKLYFEAARNYTYDRLVEEYDNASPSPSDVQQRIER